MTDEVYMQLAIDMAKKTAGQTSPNPQVGAVVVKDHQIIGLGAHLKAGSAHAEVHAIDMAGDQAAGATIYVTLEPCSFHGRTPPCADLIIASGIKRAVIATTDPNPKVAGSGIAKLREAGIDVTTGVLKEEADALNLVFYHYIKHSRPFVTLKTAVTFDGKIATTDGHSQWITGEAARKDGHLLRHQHDAILVGVGTVLADDPSLTTRLPFGGKQPIRVVLDSDLKTPEDAKLIQDNLAQTWIFTETAALHTERATRLKQNGATVIGFDNGPHDINRVLAYLGTRDVTSVLVEGGSAVNGSFITSHAVNRIVTYIAPKIVGGSQAPSAIGGGGFSDLNQALPLEIAAVEHIGDDIKIIATVKGAD